MKRLAPGMLALVTLVALAMPASAAQFGHLYPSASQTSQVSTLDIVGFASFEFYIVIEVDFADDGRGEQNATNGIKGWEAEFIPPPELQILGRALSPPSSLNVGQDDNFVVGTGTNVTAASTPTVMVTYSAGYFAGPNAPDDLVMSMTASTPSSFNPPAPGWLEFADNAKHTFTTSEQNRIVFNCVNEQECCDPQTDPNCEVANADRSWGAVKADF